MRATRALVTVAMAAAAACTRASTVPDADAAPVDGGITAVGWYCGTSGGGAAVPADRPCTAASRRATFCSGPGSGLGYSCDPCSWPEYACPPGIDSCWGAFVDGPCSPLADLGVLDDAGGDAASDAGSDAGALDAGGD